MSKLRDAAQQALEALEWADNAMYEGTPIQANTQKAITALRTALAEQPAEQEPQTEDVAADAYSHACDEMVRWQRKRRLAGKEAGTTGSLCDGIAWLYLHIDTLERTAMAEQPAEQEPGNWIVYNSGAEVASGLSLAEALEYLTPERLARQWCAVCVVDQSNLPKTPQPAKQPLTREEIFELAEPFGEFKYGDAQGHKRIDFANAIIAAYERKNGVQT